MKHHTSTRRRFVTAMGLGAVTIGGSGTATARGRPKNFRAHLTGDSQVPAVETNATGQTTFQLDRSGDELGYRLIAANIENVLMAHIHLASVGENGPVIAWLYPADGPPPELIEGRFDGVLAEAVITENELVGPLNGSSIGDLIEEIEAGNTYVNVHTEENPGGEIRGQIR